MLNDFGPWSPPELCWVDTENTNYIVGQNNVKRIIIESTGNGISGNYDIITVYLDEYEIKLPAHNCRAWGIKNRKENTV